MSHKQNCVNKRRTAANANNTRPWGPRRPPTTFNFELSSSWFSHICVCKSSKSSFYICSSRKSRMLCKQPRTSKPLTAHHLEVKWIRCRRYQWCDTSSRHSWGRTATAGSKKTPERHSFTPLRERQQCDIGENQCVKYSLWLFCFKYIIILFDWDKYVNKLFRIVPGKVLLHNIFKHNIKTFKSKHSRFLLELICVKSNTQRKRLISFRINNLSSFLRRTFANKHPLLSENSSQIHGNK